MTVKYNWGRKFRSLYLGGPIDLADKKVTDNRLKIENDLSGIGITVYNPQTAFRYGGYGEEVIKNINDFAINTVDVVFLIFDKCTTTIGTPMDLQIASAAGKFVIVVSPWESIPVYIKVAANMIFKSEREAMDYIYKVQMQDKDDK